MKTIDVTKPHRKKFLKCKKMGETPPLNTKGFWEKPEPGLKDVFKDERKADSDK